MRQPLDVAFNAAVMTLARMYLPMGWDVIAEHADAPNSLAQLNEYVRRTKRIGVWAGASDQTIYGCPEHNHAFRAWHDWVHHIYQHEFTKEGEAAVAVVQVEQLYRKFGFTETTLRWGAYLLCEVNGQAEYLDTAGHFPVDQVKFTHNHWKGFVLDAADIGFRMAKTARLKAVA